MNKSYKIYGTVIGLFSAILFAPLSSHSAAWTQPEGRTQVINNFYYYNTDTFYDHNGYSIDIGTFQKIEYNPYIEHGYKNDVTLGISPSFQYLEQDSPHNTNAGLADTEVFLRHQIWSDDNEALSYQPLIKIPGPYDDSSRPILGNGQVDFELRGLYGYKFDMLGQRDHFVDFQAAFRKRMGKPEDEFRFDATLGMRYGEQTMFLLQSFNVFSMDLEPFNSFEPTNSSDYDLQKVQFSGVQQLTDNLAAQFGLFGHYGGRNTGGDGGAIFALWVDF